MNYEQLLLDLARADERMIVMTAENRAPIRNLPGQLGNRFIDTGITEQTMVGMAAGLALRGRIPVVHALATFLTMRAFEFIRTDIGLPGLPVKLVGTVPGVLSEANGPTHQALEDISLLRGIPNMRVFCPADADDLLLGLPVILADPAPWYVRFCDRPAVAAHAPFRIGRAEAMGDATAEVTVLVAGALFSEAWHACQLLRAEGLPVRLLNMRTVQPIDEEVVLHAATTSPQLVTVEDHFARGGLFSAVSEVLAREGVGTSILDISCRDRWFTPALLPDVLRAQGFTSDGIGERIMHALPIQESLR